MKNFENKVAAITGAGSGIARSQRRILVGPDARVFDWMVRLLPSTYQRIAVGYSKFSAK